MILHPKQYIFMNVPLSFRFFEKSMEKPVKKILSFSIIFYINLEKTCLIIEEKKKDKSWGFLSSKYLR